MHLGDNEVTIYKTIRITIYSYIKIVPYLFLNRTIIYMPMAKHEPPIRLISATIPVWRTHVFFSRVVFTSLGSVHDTLTATVGSRLTPLDSFEWRRSHDLSLSEVVQDIELTEADGSLFEMHFCWMEIVIFWYGSNWPQVKTKIYIFLGVKKGGIPMSLEPYLWQNPGSMCTFSCMHHFLLI